MVAAALAQQKMEEVRNLSFNDVGVVGGIPPGTLPQEEMVNVNGQDFTVKIGVVYMDDPFDGLAPVDPISTDYKRVRVAVTWGGAFPSNSPLTMITDVVPPGLETGVGGGVLWINVINASGNPVDGANVFIHNDSVIPVVDLEVVSDSKGRVVLPGAPDCLTCYHIRAEKSGYSSDRTYSITEVTNPLLPDATIIEGEVTQLTLAIDKVSSLAVMTTGSRTNNYPPFAGVQFVLRGNRVIGTDAMDQPVYRYKQSITSGPGGLITINNLEWDTYQIYMPTGSSVDMAGSKPISPFSLLPGQNQSLWLVTAAATSHSLLMIVKDDQQNLVENATVSLIDNLGTPSAGITGPSSKGDFGQMWFSGLKQLTYTVTATKSGFLQATASASVNGDVLEILQLQPSP